MKNNSGFSFVEMLTASSILFTMILTIVPINTLLTSERTVLDERYEHKQRLHEELQNLLWETDKKIPMSYSKKINQKNVSFQFTRHSEELIKGCVQWKNVRDKQEEVCLYGYPEKQ